jgi:molecular chaperone Hsp33
MNSADGRLQIGLAAQGTLRGVAADIGGVLEEARRRLDLSPIAAVALGRALTAAALIQRISLKVSARLIVEVLGDGPLGKVIAEADNQGRLRGLVGAPQIATPADGRMALAPVVGRGLLRVTREDERSRHSSQVALVTSELGEDVAHYLEQSEQIRSAVLLGVLPQPGGIAAAGGLVDELERNIHGVEGVSAVLERGGGAALAAAVLAGLDCELLEEIPLRYRCRCSRETLRVQLLTLDRADLESIIAQDGTCEAECAFCGTTYRFPASELLATN